MFKLFILLCAISSSFGANIYKLEINIKENTDSLIPPYSEIWTDHINDFINLIDMDTVLPVLSEYLKDEEVITFLGYVLSEEFRDVILEFESMAEFREVSVIKNNFNFIYTLGNLIGMNY